ncbi:MAG TPA: DMT family transporter [Vicinamibacterales bacterium]
MIGLLLLAVFIGSLLPVQTGVNAQLRTFLGTPMATALVSFVVGTVGLLVAVLWLRTPVPLAEAWSHSAWWQWTGGLLGAIYIAAVVVLAPRLGAGTLIAAVVGGQMVASLVLDHFGLVGFPEHPISSLRLLGAALVMLGVALIQR